MDQAARETIRQATRDLAGMAAEVQDGALVIRPADSPGEALTRGKRRLLGRCFAFGMADREIAEVLKQW
jgi:hypothetical protein